MEKFERLSLLIGEQELSRLSQKTIMLFGLGGVGGYVLEALVRSGVGNFVLVDNDKVTINNFNRQILATCDTIGKFKTEVAEKRALSINPDCKIICHNTFFLPENNDITEWANADYIIDAVDTVTAKIAICQIANHYHIPVISCMGTGNKLNPQLLKVAQIEKTSVCPLARVMRRELKARNINNVKVVFSTEQPIKMMNKDAVASFAPVPAVAGFMIASEVILDLLNKV